MMTLKPLRVMARRSSRKLTRNRNRRNSLMVLGSSFVAVSVISSNIVPSPAGADGDARSFNARQFVTARVSDAIIKPTELPHPRLPANPVPPDARFVPKEDARFVPEDPENQSSSLTLLINQLMLETGVARLEHISDYSATFYKLEQADGVPGPPQRMRLKIRHEPFSVYMKWLEGDRGRELLYVDGKYNGKMLVKLGGLKGRFIPCIKLDPHGSTAMSEARHPVTEIGLLNLARRIISDRKDQLAMPQLPLRCRMTDNQMFYERPCYRFVVEFDSPEVSAEYRKSIQYVDKEYSLPVCVKNYGWPENIDNTDTAMLDEQTLIEYYFYSEVLLDEQLAEVEFDRSNKDYHFRR